MFLALRDLRRGARRFVLLGVVIALVALLSTVLSGLATGLVTDGISGLRALPLDDLAFQEGADATFSRSTLRTADLAPFEKVPGASATPLGASFANAASVAGGPRLADDFRPEPPRRPGHKPHAHGRYPTTSGQLTRGSCDPRHSVTRMS